ncbi:MAG: hypothetical protein M3N02_05795 [Pseudomonadota bacterium]|nr:hypothetical protein [Pseudomonadota bacterium]
MRIQRYDWSGGTEAMLRFGPDTGPIVIAALPLFEEANRTRAFMLSILRALAELGIGSILPDLPGTGESVTPLESTTIQQMQGAYGNIVSMTDRERRRAYSIGIRSGALLDALGLLFGRWHFAPQNGSDLLRELTRIKQAELGIAKPLNDRWYVERATPKDALDRSVEIAGNLVSITLLTELTVKTPFNEPGIPRRVARLQTDPKPADVKFDGVPLWRRAEPDNDLVLAQTLADDIAAWIVTCEG